MTHRANKSYTESEKEFIKENYMVMTVVEMAELLGRTHRSVRAQIERLGLSLNKLDRNKPFDWTKERVEYLKKHYKCYSDEVLAKEIGTSESIVTRKRDELGLSIITRQPFIQAGYYRQYVNGKRTWSHRYEAEKKVGRPIEISEPVHHIDGDKLNNSHDNLYVCNSKSHHGNIHHSLESVAFELYKQGVIKFNEEKGEYYTLSQSDTEG